MTDIGVVDLAHTADFRLGDVLVRPARRQLIRDGGETEQLQPRVMQVLVLLARAEGAVVTREELTQTCWRGLTVGEDAVNRVMSQLRRLAETLGEGAFRIETVPKVGYRMDVLAPPGAPAPPEPRPDPVLAPASQGGETARRQRRTVWASIIVAFVALLGAGAWLWNAGLHAPWSASDGPQVAVAPFGVIGGDAAARDMALAVASDSLSELGAKSIQAVAATSVAAAPASARLVLNGEIQRTETGARVTLHLFDPHARAVLWSGVVAGDPGALAPLQQQASIKAADMLTCGLNAFSPGASLDAQARVLWLRMCDTWRQAGTLVQARDAMQDLMRRAPGFSGAYAKYALATARMIADGDVPDALTARNEARVAALQALRLNREDADAYVALSLTEPPTDWRAREQWLLKGLARQPDSSDLISWRASLLSTIGRLREVLPLARRGVELDPHSIVKTASLAEWLYYAGETAEAAKIEQMARLNWPQSPDVLSLAFDLAIRNGDAPTVAKILSSPRTRPVNMLDAEARLWPKIMAERHGSSGSRGALARQIVALETRGQFNDFWGFLALHLLSEDDAAYDLMETLSKGGNDFISPDDVAVVLFQPEMSNLRRQPRFMDLAAKLGLTAYWLRSGHWPDFCSEPDLGYNCVTQARAAQSRRPV